MISAKILKHSTSWIGRDIITYVLTYPRYIHGELMTHRVFSKNSASSRAIPIEKFIRLVQEKPVKPMWTKNQSGMQGGTFEADTGHLDTIWMEGRDHAVSIATRLLDANAHKQNVNRILEPWFYHTIVLTGTDFENWFALRDHPDAQPEIQELARLMKFALKSSTPEFLQPGQWHVPYGDNLPDLDIMDKMGGTIGRQDGTLIDVKASALISRLKVSVARCARVSYNNFDGTSDVQKDIELFEKLVVSEPLHASPAEHQARVPLPNELKQMEITWNYSSLGKWEQKRGKYLSNLSGWIQLRKIIEAGEFK